MNNRIRLGLLLTLTLFSTGELLGEGEKAPTAQEPNTTADGSPKPVLLPRYPRYQLRPGDVLDLNFPFTAEFNQTVTVQPDGFINLRGIGDLHIQDKTVPAAIEMIRAAYSKILRDPVVTAELKDFEKPYFIVGGEVKNPGRYDLRGDTTILQAVELAGDLKPESKRSEVLLFRRVSDNWAEVKKIDLKRMLQGRNLDEDAHLRPGDMILVPKSTWSKIDHFIPVPSLGMFFNPAITH